MTIIDEIKGLLIHIEDKDLIEKALNELRDTILNDYNVLDIKAQLAKDKLVHTHHCVCIDDIFYIIDKDRDIPFIVTQQDSMSTTTYRYVALASGCTELIAWLNAYDVVNKAKMK